MLQQKGGRIFPCLPRVKSDAHCTQDAGLKEKQEVHTLRYDTRTRKVNNSISKTNHAQHHSKTKIEHSTSANIVNNRKINFSQHRRCQWNPRLSPSVKSYLKSTDPQIRLENSTAANVVNAIGILGFHWAWKVALKVQTLKYDSRTRKAIRHSSSSFNKKKRKLNFSQHRQCH